MSPSTNYKAPIFTLIKKLSLPCSRHQIAGSDDWEETRLLAILSKIEVSIDNNFDEAPNDLPARDTAMIFSSCWFYNLIACAREGEQPVNTIYSRGDVFWSWRSPPTLSCRCDELIPLITSQTLKHRSVRWSRSTDRVLESHSRLLRKAVVCCGHSVQTEALRKPCRFTRGNVRQRRPSHLYRVSDGSA